MTAHRRLHLNVNALGTGRHNAAWRHPSVSKSAFDIDHFLEIAKAAERDTFDAIFFADHQALDEIDVRETGAAWDRPSTFHG